MKKHYKDYLEGQIHYLSWNKTSSNTPLCLLHPSPYSGTYFETVAPLLDNRFMIAPDYPGYGNSDPLDSAPTISDFADATAEVLKDFSEPFQLLGFHTGCLVAVELSLKYPSLVDGLLLIDIPYFTGETQAALKKKMSQPLPLSADITSVQKAWDFNIASRADQISLDRGLALFVEQLKAGTRDHLGFQAAFSYDCQSRFRAIDKQTVIIATKSGLRDATLAAADNVSDAKLIKEDQIESAVFEMSAPMIAKQINQNLS